jgi:diguanylate cyclase (GGDEF)-like protein/PAS domain S-box-containing protein
MTDRRTTNAPGDEARFREMIERVRSVVMRWRADLVIEYINPYGEQLFGYAPGELAGQPLLGTIVADNETTGRSLREMLSDIMLHPELYANNENENMTKDGRKIWLSWTNEGLRNGSDEVVAMLSVGNDITALKRTQGELKRALSANEMLLKETEELNYRLSRMASTDQLTSLLNRRSMLDKLAEEFFRAQRYAYQLGVLMVDIDHFKRVNDDFGHDVGDKALKAVASTIAGAVRADDTVARYGGEEIVVIMPYASNARCWAGGERLRKAVEEATMAACAAGELPRAITVSVGGASTEDGAKDEHELLRQADELLYHSKETGRNKVSVRGME